MTAVFFGAVLLTLVMLFLTLVGENGLMSVRVVSFVHCEGGIGGLFSSLPPPPMVVWQGTGATGREPNIVSQVRCDAEKREEQVVRTVSRLW